MKRPLCIFSLFIITCICLISSAFESYAPPSAKSILLEQFIGDNLRSKVYLSGKVESINFKASENYRYTEITVGKIIIGKYSYRAIAQITGTDSVLPRIGSTVTLFGKPNAFDSATNPGQFDSKEYYETLRIDFKIKSCEILSESSDYNIFSDALFKFKRRLSTEFDKNLSPPYAGIMKTMLLGEKKEMDSSIKNLYQRNGIAHILSISGLHISLLGLGLMKLLKRVGLKSAPSAVIALLSVVLYGFMVGFSVSSVRAILMFAFSAAAVLLNRTYDIFTALTFCALIIIISNPSIITSSAFGFSFGCVLGIAMIPPALIPPKSKYLHIISPVIMILVGLPWYYLYFYQLPVYSFIINAVIVPSMSILIVGGIMLLLFSFLFPPLVILPKALIIGLLTIIEKIALLSDNLPGHFYTPGAPTYLQVFIYLSIFLVIYSFRKRLTILVKWFFAILAIIILTVRIRPEFEFDMLDVGQGECLFIRESSQIAIPGITPEVSYLIDGGSTSVSDVGTYRIIPFLKSMGVYRLDGILVTHPDTDHISGITELLSDGASEGILIKHLFLSDCDLAHQNDNYIELETLAYENDIPVTYLHTGMSLSNKQYVAGSNHDVTHVSLSVLSPEKSTVYTDINASSIILFLKYGSFSALLPGDAPAKESENALRALADSDVTVLKAAHHGSSTALSEEMLKALSPKIAVVSCGLNNSYGHPHQETLELLSEENVTVYRTDLSGEISLKIRGNKLRTDTYQ